MRDCIVEQDIYKNNVPFIFIIRWNPDEMDQGTSISLEDRIQCIADRINYYIDCDKVGFKPGVVHVEYHFYHSKCRDKIEYAKNNSDSCIVINDA